MKPPPRWLPTPFLPLAIAGLFLGVWGGLFRLGWPVPLPTFALSAFHGALMVSGFFGTVITLERAVATGRWWAFAAPALSAGGSVAIALLDGPVVGLTLMAAAGGVLTLLYLVVLLRRFELHLAVMALGAVAWCTGNILWAMNWPSYTLWPCWSAFLVLTIAGERLELSRILALSRGKRAAFLAAIVVVLAGVGVASAAHAESLYDHSKLLYGTGTRLVAGGFLALALWLLRYDLARKNLARPGLPRFAAVSLISGYVWLAFAGALGLYSGPQFATPFYDALLHAIFLGFVFVMVIAHAPIVFPVILGLPLGFHRWFYAPLVLIHVSLLVRVGSDLASWSPGRQWGGILNIVAIVSFLFGTLIAVGLGTAPEEPAESGKN